MGSSKDSEWYDSTYRGRAMIDVDESSHRYLWTWAARRVLESDAVLELGCGRGELSSLLPEQTPYLGVDFSEIAIKQAQRQFPAREFVCATLPEWLHGRQTEETVMVAVEYLEHVVGDLNTIRWLPRGTRIISTVPSFDSVSHVRHFASGNSVVSRYGDLIKFDELVRITGLSNRHHWGFTGFRR